MALGCKKRIACGRRRQKRNPRREESETKEEGVPTTTTINFHMCEVPAERLPFTGWATQPPPQLPLTQPQPNPELLHRLLRRKDADDGDPRTVAFPYTIIEQELQLIQVLNNQVIGTTVQQRVYSNLLFPLDRRSLHGQLTFPGCELRCYMHNVIFLLHFGNDFASYIKIAVFTHLIVTIDKNRRDVSSFKQLISQFLVARNSFRSVVNRLFRGRKMIFQLFVRELRHFTQISCPYD